MRPSSFPKYLFWNCLSSNKFLARSQTSLLVPKLSLGTSKNEQTSKTNKLLSQKCLIEEEEFVGPGSETFEVIADAQHFFGDVHKDKRRVIPNNALSLVQ
ncbi:hypothetical protein FBR05_08465 [Deltaproteobacteria bacterium PRO3]|nr:hypothetical protein [Deltaproteobacteria bacterium PRO3]